MKTIRANCFETNSSSTHSVTISSKSKSSKRATNPLVTDNVLDPSNLNDYEVGAGDNSFLNCDTVDKKAAIVVHWLTCQFKEREDLTQEQYDKALNILAGAAGYTKIKPLKYYNFYPDGEYSGSGDEDYINEMGDDDFEPFKKFILDVVLNDDMEIVDSDTAN